MLEARSSASMYQQGHIPSEPLVGAVHPWRALAHRHITCLCLGHDTCVSVFTPSYKDIHHVGLGPTLMTSASLSHLCRDPASIHRDHELGLHIFFFFLIVFLTLYFDYLQNYRIAVVQRRLRYSWSRIMNCWFLSTKKSLSLSLSLYTHTLTQINIIFVLTIWEVS